MGPAAILSILVQTKGVGSAKAELTRLDSTARKAGGGLAVAEKSSKKTHRSFVNMATVAGGAAVGVGGLIAVGKTLLNQYEESAKIGRQTNAVLKSTGGVANVSAKQVGALATAISQKTGVDDEAIQSGENLLLTFTNIRNEAGKGNDIFNQTTQAVTDLSAALGQDTKSSAIQLGKALNDPVKGVTALQRVGVSFTAKQKDTIKSLEASGKHLQAQKLILREVKTEFGGSAAAIATPFDKLKVTLRNLQETLGGALAPVLEDAAGWLNTFIGQLQDGKGAGGQVVDAFNKVKDAVGDLLKALQPLGESVAQIVGWLKEHQSVAKILIPTLIGLAAAIWLVNTAMAANPFVLGALAVAAFVVAIVTAYRESETFRKILDGVVGGIVTGVTVGFAAIQTAFQATVGFVRGVMSAVTTEIGKWKLLATVVKVAVGLMVAYVTPAFAALKGIVGVGMAVLGASFKAGWGVIKAIFQGAWIALKAVVTGGLQAVHGVIQVIGGIFKGDFGQIWDGIKNIFKGGLHAITGLFRGELKTITGAAGAIGSGILSAITGGFKAALRGVTGFVNSIIGVVNSVLGFLHLPKIPTIGGGGGGTSLKGIENYGAEQAPGGRKTGLARGGAFARTGGMVKNPITLMGEEAPRHPEFVIPTNPAYRKRAKGLLAQAAGVIGYAKGGVVSGRASVFGPPLEKAGGTAYGFSSAQPGIAVNPHMGANTWNDSLARSFARQVAKVTVNGHSANLRVIDKGPAIPGRAIDITGSGASQMGINPAQFPTDAVATAVFGDGGGKGGGGIVGSVLGAIGGVVQALNPAKYIAKLPGTGDLPPFLKGVGKSVLKSVKHWITEKAKSIFTGGGGVGGPDGTTEYDGKSVAKWIVPALEYARAHGWTGHLTSGYRSHAYNLSQGRNYFSNHEGVQYPGGAIDVGGYGAKAEGAALNAALAGYTGRQLVWGGPTIGDWGHFSATGHAKGGRYGKYIGAYKNGGPVPEDGIAMLHKGEFVVPRKMAEGGAWAANRASFYGQAWEKALKTSSPSDDALVANAAVMFYSNAAAGQYGSSFQRVGIRELKKWKQLRASVPFLAQGRPSDATGFLKIPETQGVNPGSGGVAAAGAAPASADSGPSAADIQQQILDTLKGLKAGVDLQNARAAAVTGSVDGTLTQYVTEMLSGRMATTAALGGQLPSSPGFTGRL